MNDEALERELRAWYRTEIDDTTVAPADLRADVLSIPKVVVPIRRLPTGRRHLTLLIAAAIATAAIVGSAIVGSGFLPTTPMPSQLVTTPIVGPTPTPAASVASIVANRQLGVLAILRDAVYNHGGHLWVTSFDGSAAHELFPNRTMTDVGGTTFDIVQDGLAWSPDGTRLIFSELGKLYLSDASGSDPQILDTRCQAPCVGDHFPSFSSDGTQLAFNREITKGVSRTSVIATMDLASGRVVQLDSTALSLEKTDPGIAAGAAWHERPRWSPDGHKIVFSRWHLISGGPNGFFLVDADGSNLHAVAADGIGSQDPEWSPDGSRIVFSSLVFLHNVGDPNAERRANIYTIRPDGTDRRQLTSDNISGGSTWTDDGRIVFTKNPGASIVPGEAGSDGPFATESWIMDADGANAARLARLPSADDSPFGDQTALQPTP